MPTWSRIADDALAGRPPRHADALAVLGADPAELMPILAAAFRVRRAHYGLQVRIHVLQNAKRESRFEIRDWRFEKRETTSD